MDDKTRLKAFEIANGLRTKGIAAECDLMARSVKAQFKYADKIGAEYTAVIGESEMESGKCNLKKMSDGTVTEVAFADIYSFLTNNNQG